MACMDGTLTSNGRRWRRRKKREVMGHVDGSLINVD